MKDDRTPMTQGFPEAPDNEHDDSIQISKDENLVIDDMEEDEDFDVVPEYPLPKLGRLGNWIAAKIASIPKPKPTDLSCSHHMVGILQFFFPQSVVLGILSVILRLLIIITSIFHKRKDS